MADPTTSTDTGRSETPAAERILDAALTCVARVGFAKTTLDDVARAAGCSRATVYRHHPGKAPLVRALVEREARRFRADLEAAVAGADDLAGALGALVTTSVRLLRGHEALATLVEHELEVLLPHLTFDGVHDVLGFAGDVGEASLARFLDRRRARRAGEWLARIVLSHLASPSPYADLDDERSVARLVADFVLAPGAPSPAAPDRLTTTS